jgi:HK97 gp10 family phage protein
MAFNFSIEGVSDIRKALAGKQKEIEEIFVKDLNEGGDLVLHSARSKAPIGATKHLISSIDKNEIRDKNGIIDVYVGIEKNEWFSKEDKYYPRFIEKGTSKMKARPYLRPALNENKKQIQSKIEADIKELIGNEGNL